MLRQLPRTAQVRRLQAYQADGLEGIGKRLGVFIVGDNHVVYHA